MARIASVRASRLFCEQGDVVAKGGCYKAINIIDNGLKVGLDQEKLAVRLVTNLSGAIRLYDSPFTAG